jgi:hypothetical protein
MVWQDSRRVRYSEFQSAAKQFDTPALLKVIADMSARLKQFEGWDPAWASMAPWSLSIVAREAIMSSKRSGGKPLDRRRFLRLMNLLKQVDEIPYGGLNTIPYVMSLNYAQFSYQLSAKEEIARVMLVLLETDIDQASKSTDELADLLLAPVEDVAIATFILWAFARSHRGMLHPDQIRGLYRELPHLQPPIESILGTLTRLTTTVDAAREDGASAVQMKGALQQYGYNPLTRTPFVEVGDGWLCAPQTQFILRTCSLESIYYAGQRKWPGTFSTELGHRVEAYIGTQLRHTGELEVSGEFTTGVGKMSTDWMVVTPAAVILIESKGARVPLAARAGVEGAAQLITDRLAQAYTQLNRTATGIRSAAAPFRHLPNDRPIIGLIVTVEPVYLGNSPEVRELLPDSEIPIGAVSVRDLEELASWEPDQLGDTLLSWVTDPLYSGWDLWGALSKMEIHSSQGNAILDDAFRRYVSDRVPPEFDDH